MDSAVTTVLFDDTDPAIHYSGPWVASSAMGSNRLDLTGSPMFDTLHTLPSFNGTFSLNFTGTGVSVFIANFGDFRNYTSQCFVDGHSLPTVIDQDDPNQSGSNIRLCAGFSLPDQQHSLFVSVSVPVDQNPAQHGWSTGFFLGYIVVEPSSSSNLDRMNKILAFVGNPFGGSPPAAPVVDTSSGMPWWFTAGRGVFQYTFSLPFTGIGVQWVGFYDEPNMPWNTSLASYTIDGEHAIQFNTTPAISLEYYQSVASSRPRISWQVLFISNKLKYGNHSLHVAFNTSKGTTPLTLQSIVIQAFQPAEAPQSTINAVPILPTTTPQNISPSFTTSTSQSQSTDTSHVDVGAVAGGSSVGAFILLLAISVLCVFLIRRRRRRAHARRGGERQIIEDLTPDPFPTASQSQRDHTVVGPRKARGGLQGVNNPLMQELEAPPVTKWTRTSAQPNRPRPVSNPIINSTVPQEIISVPGLQSISHLEPAVSNAGSEQRQSQPNHDALTSGSGANVDLSVTPRPRGAMYEEDSGIRLTRRDEVDTPFSVFPPVYTTH